jgi:hypothetical protein
MTLRRFLPLAMGTVAVWSVSIRSAPAQASLNPDISVIPRFVLTTDDGKHLDEGKRTFRRPEFSLEELEVGLQSALNPYARADIFFTLAGPDVESARLGLEEAYATILKGLPLDLNVRFGKYRVEYGKLNTIHAHAWPFVTQPFVLERFLGEEGLNDLGVSFSSILPTGDLYTRLTMDILRGTSIGEAAGLADTSGETSLYAVSARLMTFVPLDDNSDLEIGLSVLTGRHDPYTADRFRYLHGDCKYKYRPDVYTSLTLQAEYLMNSREASKDRAYTEFLDAAGRPERRSITSSGLYVFADYQFQKVFGVGARYDWCQSPYDADDRARGVALWFGFYPVEETLVLRLQYQNTSIDAPGLSESVNAVTLQLMFSLGPHKAHSF